jgi:hypothetical protein
VQGNQNVGCEGKKPLRFRSLIQPAREGGIAKILQQQESPGIIPGQNGGRAETELQQMFINPAERRDGFPCLRSVHEDGAFCLISQAEIFPGGGVSGERFAGGDIPAGGTEKLADVDVQGRCNHGWTPINTDKAGRR